MDELAEVADGLSTNELGYDVFSRIKPILVKYDKGEFIGGNDILMEMYDAGEIQELIAGIGV